jgi:hypothetical protein
VFPDVGTASYLPSGNSESDVITQTSNSTDNSVVSDTLTSTNTKTGSDGTVTTQTGSSSSTDTITGGLSDTSTDHQTVTFDAAGANYVVNDHVTYYNSANSTDNYTQSMTSSSNIAVPQTGGTTTMTGSYHMLASGTAISTTSSIGETNTASPAVNNNTVTGSFTNVDHGTTTSQDSLSMNMGTQFAAQRSFALPEIKMRRRGPLDVWPVGRWGLDVARVRNSRSRARKTPENSEKGQLASRNADSID